LPTLRQPVARSRERASGADRSSARNGAQHANRARSGPIDSYVAFAACRWGDRV